MIPSALTSVFHNVLLARIQRGVTQYDPDVSPGGGGGGGEGVYRADQTVLKICNQTVRGLNLGESVYLTGVVCTFSLAPSFV